MSNYTLAFGHLNLIFTALCFSTCLLILSFNFIFYRKQNSNTNNNTLIDSILKAIDKLEDKIEAKKTDETKIETETIESSEAKYSFAQHLIESGTELEQVAIKCHISHDEAALIKYLRQDKALLSS